MRSQKPISVEEVIFQLEKYNKWRKGDETIEQPNPTRIGILLEQAIKKLEEYGANIGKNCD